MKESFEDCSFSSIIPVNFFNENSGLEDATIISIELEERTIEQQQFRSKKEQQSSDTRNWR